MSTLDIVLNIMAEKVDISAIKITVDTKIREEIFDDIFSLVIDIEDMLDITIADEEIDKIIRKIKANSISYFEKLYY